MNENKYVVARSFSRKINLGNYETADFFSSHSETLDTGYEPAYVDELSIDLYEKAKADVERSIAEYLGRKEFDLNRFMRVVDSLSIGNPISVEDFESLNELEMRAVQSVKRAYKRSPMAKEKDAARGEHQ